MMRPRWTWGAWILVHGCASAGPPPEATSPVPAPEILAADKAPVAIGIDEPIAASPDRFVLSTFVGTEPAQPRAALVIGFGASWCRPCLDELPELGALAKARAPIPFVLIGLDRDAEGQRAFALAAQPYPFVVLSDEDQSTADAYGVDTLPTVLLLDARARVRYVHFGADPKAVRALDAALTSILPRS